MLHGGHRAAHAVGTRLGGLRGPAGIRRFFADVEDAGPDFHLNLECIRAVGTNQILTFMNIYGKIRRLRIFADRQQALEAAGLRE